ncbi:porin family protein [Flavobacterium gelatinilyticum]|mgnify:CR=1 FL=1|uniref:porin family protein n=1 Tax=Flavobacterium gelatinilyticum TaxID=3003260 RepID=UPI00247FE662|nr:porin family protein [Flavobacterium gelatinilyticum]
MKKIAFLFFTLTLITFKTTAQDSKIKFGLQTGLTYTGFRGYDSSGSREGFSYLFGASFQFPLKEKLSIKADLNYERKTQISEGRMGSWENGGMTYRTIKATAYYNYITLPVLLKYTFSSKNFYVNGGPYVGYLLKSGMKSKSWDGDMENTKYRKRFDFGIAAGFGKEFKLTQKHLLYLELRDNLGLTDVAKPAMPTDAYLKFNTVSLIAGITL